MNSISEREVLSQTIRVLVADDHPMIRESIAAAIASREDMELVGEAADGKEAVELCSRLKPDVVVLDLRMPEMDGVEVAKAIRECSPRSRIIVLTAYQGDEDIYRALQAGASGYLLKDSTRTEVLDGIQAVFKGQKLLSQEAAARLAWRIGQSELTSRELEVLNEMATGKTNIQIGAALFISDGTVKAHINNILNKLGVSDRTQAIVTAVQRGIVRLE